MSAWLPTHRLRGFEKAASGAFALTVVIVAAAYGVAGLFGASGQRIATLAAIYGVCAIGLRTFSGETGIVSFGHAGFIGIGAYVSALLTMPATLQRTALPLLPPFLAGHELGFASSLIIAALTGGAFGFVTGLVLARLKGSSASIASLGLLIIVYTLLSGAREITRGNQTFYGAPRWTTFEIALGFAVAAAIVASLFKESRLGLFARAARDDEAAAMASGIDPFGPRLAAWTLSAAICAVGGALLGHYLGAFSPRTFYFDLTFNLLAMVILGGLSGVTGAVCGVAGTTALLEVLRAFETGLTLGPITTPPFLGIGGFGIGLGVLLMLTWRPRGLAAGRELLVPLPNAVRRRRAIPSSAPVATADLTVERLSKRYAGLIALDDVTCRMSGGRITGLIGPNGAGKTTLVNLIAGHAVPTSGTIRLGETVLTRLAPAAIARRGVGRTFQNIRVFTSLTVFENVFVAALGAGASRREAAAVAEREIGHMDLIAEADRPAGTLAYGPRRRLEIARALAMRPRLLLLDEPAAGMNAAETQDLKRRLAAVAESYGLAVLLIDHDLPFVMGLSQHVLVFDRGRLIASGSPADVQKNPEVIAAYIGAPATAEAELEPSI